MRCNVPGLPYVDDRDQITGRISIRDVYKRIAVPDNLLNLADAMGDQTDKLDLPEIRVMEIMASPVEAFLLEKMSQCLSSLYDRESACADGSA